jgi:rod shape determining protein RodA
VTREKAMERGKIWRHFDFWLMGAVTLLIIFGIAMIRSTTLTSIDTSLQELTNRQILYTIIGAFVFFAVIAIDYRLWGALSNTIYVTLMALLLLVETLAVAKFGAARWLDLGIIQFQPSELGKFLIVLTLGNLVASRAEEISRLNFVLQTLIHVGLPVVLIFLQPDLSTAIIYGVVWFAILWAAGLRWQHIALFGTITIIVLPLAFITIVETPGLSYMARRIIVFLLPDPSSPEYQDAAYNINQALISIGSGGWFGQGYGHGSQVQLRFLKVRHTDFIFSAISNEFGFVGALFVILLLAFVVYRIFRAGRLARDTFGSYVCYGVGAIILYQSFFNIGMNMKLLPVAGLPLPFVSYGGSSLWTFLFGIGLVESVILRQKQIEF